MERPDLLGELCTIFGACATSLGKHDEASCIRRGMRFQGKHGLGLIRAYIARNLPVKTYGPWLAEMARLLAELEASSIPGPEAVEYWQAFRDPARDCKFSLIDLPYLPR